MFSYTEPFRSEIIIFVIFLQLAVAIKNKRRWERFQDNANGCYLSGERLSGIDSQMITPFFYFCIKFNLVVKKAVIRTVVYNMLYHYYFYNL